MIAGEISPDELVTERLTVKLPAEEYGCVTFFAVKAVVLNQVASPNDQFQYRMPVPDVVSLNWTLSGS